MAEGKDYKLSVLLGISENQIVPQTRSAIKALLELEKVQKRVGKGTPASTPSGAPARPQRPATPLQEIRIAREQLKLQREGIKLEGERARTTRQRLNDEMKGARDVGRLSAQTTREIVNGTRQRIGVTREETKLYQDRARLSQISARTTSAADMSAIRLMREKIKLAREEINLRNSVKSRIGVGGVVTGIGAAVAGGAYLRAGYRDSTTLEDARANLQATITKVDPTTGKPDTVLSARQMTQLNALGTTLGNQLPGDTMQYLDLFSTLKQRGLQVQDVIGGAGKSSAYLSVANRTDPQQTARELATYGNIYGFRGAEYEKSADLLSRIKTAKDLDSGELIEASKYFQGRAGAPLGLKGLEGAEQSTRFLAFMREKTGMEGSSVGTASSTFLTQLIKKPKELAALSKRTGTDLSITDKQGKFIGLESVVAKFAKLDGKLSNKDQVAFGSKIAGDEGSAVFSALVSKGREYRAFNDSINSTIGMVGKVDALTQTTASRVEALKGTYANLNAEVFGSLTKSLDPLIDRTNTYLGQLQGVAAQYPKVASLTGGIIGIGGAAIGATTGISGLINKLGMVGGSGSSVPSVVGSVLGSDEGMLGAYGVYKGVKGILGAGRALLTNPVALGAGAATLGGTMATLVNPLNIAAAALAAGKITGDYAAPMKSDFISRLAGRPSQQGTNTRMSEVVGSGGQAQILRNQAPQLAEPRVMRSVIADAPKLGLSNEAQASFLKTLEVAFPASFKEAMSGVGAQMQAATGSTAAALLDLQGKAMLSSFSIASLIAPSELAAPAIGKMIGPANELVPRLISAASSARAFGDAVQGAASRINAMEFIAPVMPTAGAIANPQASTRQATGTVERASYSPTKRYISPPMLADAVAVARPAALMPSPSIGQQALPVRQPSYSTIRQYVNPPELADLPVAAQPVAMLPNSYARGGGLAGASAINISSINLSLNGDGGNAEAIAEAVGERVRQEVLARLREATSEDRMDRQVKRSLNKRTSDIAQRA